MHFFHSVLHITILYFVLSFTIAVFFYPLHHSVITWYLILILLSTFSTTWLARCHMLALTKGTIPLYFLAGERYKKKKQNQEKGKTILFTSMMNTVLVIGHFCAPMASSNARLPWHRCANPSRETPDYTDHCKRVMRGSWTSRALQCLDVIYRAKGLGVERSTLMCKAGPLNDVNSGHWLKEQVQKPNTEEEWGY